MHVECRVRRLCLIGVEGGVSISTPPFSARRVHFARMSAQQKAEEEAGDNRPSDDVIASKVQHSQCIRFQSGKNWHRVWTGQSASGQRRSASVRVMYAAL
jgi:hypothetical protein